MSGGQLVQSFHGFGLSSVKAVSRLSGTLKTPNGFLEMYVMPLNVQHMVLGGERTSPTSGGYSSNFFTA